MAGGSRGIGLETAVVIAGMGARVLIASSNQYTGESAVRQIQGIKSTLTLKHIHQVFFFFIFCSLQITI